MLKRSAFLVLCLSAVYHRGETLPQRARPQRRPAAFSFQSFDHSGFPEDSSPVDISSQFGPQLTSSSASLTDGIPEVKHRPQVRLRGNEIHDRTANIPLYKQSIPGVYVKGHATESLNKYEPTRQVAHHHGPNYNFPRSSIASDSPFQNSFDDDGGNLFTDFN